MQRPSPEALGAIAGRYAEKNELDPSDQAKKAGEGRDLAIFEARKRIDQLERTLSALMFGETKNLTAEQKRWVGSARSKMTDGDAMAFSRMETTDEIYALAAELHRRAQADPMTKYKPAK